MGGLFTGIPTGEWNTLQQIAKWWRAQPKNGSVPNAGPPQNAGRPNAVVMLLEDIQADEPGYAALLKKVSTTETQLVSTTGYAAPNATQSQLRIGFQPSANAAVEWTGTIQADADAATVQAELEGLPSFKPGEVIVQAGHRTYDGEEYETYRWLIHFRGRYAGTDVPLLQTEEVGGDVYADSVVSETVMLEDTGKVEKVSCALPLGDPTPLRRGAICVCVWVFGFGYVIVAAECRDLVPQPASG